MHSRSSNLDIYLPLLPEKPPPPWDGGLPPWLEGPPVAPSGDEGGAAILPPCIVYGRVPLKIVLSLLGIPVEIKF